MTLDFSIFQRGREQRPQAAAQAHAEVMAQGADCLRCPLYGLARGPVRAELKPNSTLTIVGEAPGGNEVDERKPFVGKSGRILNEALAEGGLDRSQDVAITNAIACWPPDTNLEAYLLGLKRDHERDVKKAEREGREVPELVTPLDACAKRLAHDLALANSKTVCAVGGTALAALAKHYGVAFGSQRVRSGDVRVAKVSKQRGAPVLLSNGVTLLASYHPAFAMRGKPEFMPVIKADIAKAARIAKRGGKLDWHEPEFLLDPSPDVIVNVLERMRLWSISTGQPVTIDIETDSKYPHKARLRCIGLGAVIDGAEIVICVPFRHMDGRDWWARDADKLRVANAVRSLLDDAHLAGQNLAYDTTVLLRTTLFGKRDKAWLDTMIAHHDSDHSELPHDLGFIAAQYLEAPRWKEDADSKEIENVDDQSLHTYNCLMEGTPVVLADGSTTLIEELVRKHQSVEVLSLSPEGAIEAKRVVGWHRQRVSGQTWIQIQTEQTRPHERGLIVTPDHRIYTQRGWIPACEVTIDDEVALPEIALTATQLAALRGTLLGDSILTVSPHYRKNRLLAHTAALAGGHVAEVQLAEHKVRVLQPHAQLGALREWYNPTNARTPFQSLRTKNLIQLARLLPEFYAADGTRRLREDTLEVLGAIGLAWWFMDDGCRQRGQIQPSGRRGPDTVCLALCRYPREDVEMAVAWFRCRYGMLSAGKDKVLRFGRAATDRFCQEIAPYVAPGVRYKLPQDRAWPDFIDPSAPTLPQPLMSKVTSARVYQPRRDTKRGRGKAETRFCLTVEGHHNFFTSFCLVANCKDVLGTMRLLPLVYQRTVNTSQTGALNTDTALAPVARDMGDLGLIYDHEERLRHYRAQRDKAAKELALIRSVVGSADFNPGSTRQLREWLYADLKLTPPFATDGTPWDEVEEDEEGTHLQDPSTNEAAVQALLNAGVPENIERSLESLLRWRAAEKLRGTYICLRDVKDASDAKRAKAAGRRLYQVDGRMLVDTSQVSWDPTPLGEMPILHPTFKIHVVPTGRFSATPNVMAWPERPVNMRSMIQAAPGHRFVGADLDQIELRLVVLFSGDALLWDAIRKKMDVHCLNYASMEAPRAGVPISTIYEQLIAMGGKKNPKVAHMRNIAKRFAYLVFYGGEVDKLYQTMSTERTPDGALAFPGLKYDDVKTWYEAWHKFHPETRAWQDRVVQGWRRFGFISSAIDGRKRYFIGGEDRNAMINMPVQSSAASIMNRAFLRIARACPHRGWSWFSGPILQVHDCAIVQVPTERADEAERLIVESMTTELDGMPITCESKQGDRWSKL